MSPIICRLLPFAVADGPHQMAADEVLLESAVSGRTSLRFYAWREATVSLGYFQKEELRRADPNLSALAYVRRPTGGGTLVHHHEITYALTLPAGVVPPVGTSWLVSLHSIWATALAKLGVHCSVQPAGEEVVGPGPLCFKHFTPGDLIMGTNKIAGSAQRRHRGALLQHGAILLAGSAHAPVLPGILDLTGKRLTPDEVCPAVCDALTEFTDWTLTKDTWTNSESNRVQELMKSKYSQDWWNRKR
jgi:lipoate-protein ligase A